MLSRPGSSGVHRELPCRPHRRWRSPQEESMDKGDLIYRAKTAYAGAARQAGRALTKVGVVGDEAPDRDHRLRHWAYSLTKVHDSLAIAELDVPWWTYRAIDVVEAWLAA